MPTANGLRGSTTKIFLSLPGCCRRPCGRTLRRCMPSRVEPTTSRTNPASTMPNASDSSRHGSAVCTATSASASPIELGADEIFKALAHTIRSCRLPLSLFTDLLSAFRQDISTNRYETWADLLDYCRRSANPVGRLVLRIAGYDDSSLDAQSDALCTALQLTNFWQDLGIDWRKGRLYVPLHDRDRAGARDADLDAGRVSPEWEAALAALAVRTRSLFEAGRPVCDGVRGRLRWELRLTWLGASLILDRLEQVRFDVFRRRPALGATDALPLAWRALRWSPARDPVRTTPTPDPVEEAVAASGARYQFLLLVPGAASGQATCNRRCLGFLPRRGRCRGRSRGDGHRHRRGRTGALAERARGGVRWRIAGNPAGPSARTAGHPVPSSSQRVRHADRGRRDGRRPSPIRNLPGLVRVPVSGLRRRSVSSVSRSLATTTRVRGSTRPISVSRCS